MVEASTTTDARSFCERKDAGEWQGSDVMNRVYVRTPINARLLRQAQDDIPKNMFRCIKKSGPHSEDRSVMVNV